MKNTLRVLIFVFSVALTLAEGERPNIILLLTNSRGWDLIGFVDNEVVQVHQLDTLVKMELTLKRCLIRCPILVNGESIDICLTK